MRTLIHIGQHKTGTTSIQHYLKYNRTVLCKQGLYVPDSIASYESPSHYILNIYALAQERMSPMKESFLRDTTPDALDLLNEKLPVEIEKHYQAARQAGCTDIIWSNEGLYLLNSVYEFKKLTELFEKHSNELVCICCFRELDSYKRSYKKQLAKTAIPPSTNSDSYRYTEDDSWLFDYPKKRELLANSFENTLFINYTEKHMVERFMRYLGYPVNSSNTEVLRLNVTPV